MPHVQPGAKAYARRKAGADDREAKSKATAQAREAFYEAMAKARRAESDVKQEARLQAVGDKRRECIK